MRSEKEAEARSCPAQQAGEERAVGLNQSMLDVFESCMPGSGMTCSATAWRMDYMVRDTRNTT